MIAAGELQEFVPFGRDHCKNHPNAVNLQLRQLQPASELWSSDGAAGLVGSLREVTLHEKQRESWHLRKGTGGDIEEVEFEEELYVAGNMVIWTRGSKNQASYVYKAFTVDSPVLQAVWCNFSVPQNKEMETEIIETVCIVQNTCVNIHSVNGKDFISPLPFQVASVWPSKFGLLFERSNPGTDVTQSPPREPLPTVFSMLHPLDEIAPVCKSAGLFEALRVQYVSDSTLKIVFISCEPSIVMTYDTVQNVHTIWALREVKPEEQAVVLKYPDQIGTPQNMAVNSSLTAHLRNVSKDSPAASPFQNYSSLHSQGRTTSSPGLHSRSHSPAISNMAALSRSHSPAIGVPSFSGVQRFNMSYTPSPKRYSTSHSPNSTFNDSLLANEAEPIAPRLCIDHLWTETVSNHRERNCQATKAFITSDLCEQKFLCFLVESQHQLRCVKFLESNDLSQLIFLSVTTISARDAAPIEGIDAMLVLEVNGSLVLYTGVARVVMLSPVPELRGSTKFNESSLIEDCTVQPFGTYVHAMRDPVHNRVTLEMNNGSLLRISIPEIANSELVRKCLLAIKYILPKEIAVKVLIKWYNIHNAPGGPSCHSEWNVFVTCLMTLMGYSTDRLGWTRNLDLEGSLSPVIAPKKARPSEMGSDDTETPSPAEYQAEWCRERVFPLYPAPFCSSTARFWRHSPLECPTPGPGMYDHNIHRNRKVTWPMRFGAPEWRLVPSLEKRTMKTEDWEYLLGSEYNRQVDSHLLASALNLDSVEPLPPNEELSSQLSLDHSAPLFCHIPAVFYVLHLVYEELKLDNLMRDGTRSLVILLLQMARDLQFEEYIDFYWRDYPSIFKTSKQSCIIDQAQIGHMNQPSFFTVEPPCVFQWLSCCLKGGGVLPFPYLPGICERTKLVVLSFALYILGDDNAVSSDVSKYLVKISAGQKKQVNEQDSKRMSMIKPCVLNSSIAEKLVIWLTNTGFTLKDLESVPFGAALPIRDAIYQCRKQPSSDWSEAVCLLIGRQDLTKQAHEVTLAKGKATIGQMITSDMPPANEAEEEDDGMNDMNQEVMSLIWSKDLRVQEVRRLLQSALSVRVNVVHLPEFNDHEYIEEKENKLLQLCQRTMSLPVGRGMFTLFSYHPVPTEPLPVPKLNLTGRAPPRNTTVDLNSGNIDVPPNMASWSSFHNGVAAGLKIAPASQIDSAWIAYNKPKNAELANEYAGFLMALGLNGHLTKLATLNIHDYLTKVGESFFFFP
ncbi:Anaphase-promoting complex subunit 1 [Acipenser ruthenus]|uniref:Anaphase-promoting complex subunit 1 n=1 Tax=Acipenser ruthenus TaxID=7906 RepID=A0A444TWA3_ACIRT|nr:Anaphase-promoting complex subunit 1 [Acipenser ruthenus]